MWGVHRILIQCDCLRACCMYLICLGKKSPLFHLCSQTIRTGTASGIRKLVGQQMKNSAHADHSRCQKCLIHKKFTFMHCNFFQKQSKAEPLVSCARCLMDTSGISCFMIEICSLSEKKSQHVSVYLLWRYWEWIRKCRSSFGSFLLGK